MMREILFRGKRVATATFVYGCYLLFYNRNHSIVNDIGNFWVIPETVGQFTGLTDKNGKKIFEGDIVKHFNRSDDPSAFVIGKIFWNDKKCRWSRTTDKPGFVPEVWKSSAEHYEVIGNIHDNPELLEGGVEECG